MGTVRSKVFHLTLLVILTFISYFNIFFNGFAWDDRDFLLNWPKIKGSSELPAYLSLPYLLGGDVPLNHRGVYRPVRSVFYLVSYNFFGENPLPYHIQAVILYTLIVLVIYFLSLELTKNKVLSFIVSALFATHPIHTESVSYITASFDNLGILFFFLSFYFYIKKKIFASVLYGFLAFFTYEMTLVLPLIITFYEFCINNYNVKKTLKKFNKYKHFILLLVVYILIRFILLGVGNRADYLGPVWQIAANQVRITIPEIFTGYIWWLTYPVNLTISHNVPVNFLTGFLELLAKVDPSGNLVDFFENISFLFPIIYASLALIFLFIFFKKYPLLLFALSWIVISILPVSNIIPQGASLAERFLYIPSYGFVLFLGLLIYSGYKYLPQFFIFLSLFLICFYTFQTISRNVDWKNELTIWESAVEVDPVNPLALRALAGTYVRSGDIDKGIEFYERAIEINVPSGQLNSDLGLAYEKKGDIDKAIELQYKALEINSVYQPAHVILGDIYFKQEKFNLAEQQYKKALEIQKDSQTLLYLGNLYFSQGEYNKALEAYREAFKISYELSKVSYDIAYQIGLTYIKQEKYEEAIDVFKKSLTLNPKQPKVVEELSKAEEQIKSKNDL